MRSLISDMTGGAHKIHKEEDGIDDQSGWQKFTKYLFRSQRGLDYNFYIVIEDVVHTYFELLLR